MQNPEGIREIDTNLSEDSRERLIVLSELNDKWNSTVEEWRIMNSKYIRKNILSHEEELSLYQVIVGTFPLQTDAEYESRLKEYMVKSLRKVDHSGKHFDKKEFSTQVFQFIDEIFSPHHSFFPSLSNFLDEIVDYGIINSLVEVTIKMTSPGLTDIYKENIYFDFNPPNEENKRKINPDQLKLSLQKFSKRNDRVQFINELWNTRRNSEIKHWLLTTLFEQRNKQNDLFLLGEYIPLKVRGSKSENILAFARELGSEYFITVVPLFLYSISEKETYVDWGNTVIEFPILSSWHNPIDEKTYQNTMEIKINELLKNFPVACLKKI